MNKAPTPAQLRALRRAAKRKDGALLPIVDVAGNALQMLIDGLIRRGLVTNDANPLITAAGRDAITEKVYQ